jgi:tetratricopeptide (TPR) repeat protein
MKKIVRVFFLFSLFSLPFTVQANGCDNSANKVRMADGLDEAIDAMDDCLSDELQRVARTYLLLGLTYYDTGEHKKAIANYSKAIELAPNYVTALANRELSHSMNNEYDLALAYFEQAISVDPDYMQAYYFRAFAHQRHGDFRRAVEDFNTALTLTTDSNEMATIYYNRGRANKERKAYADALADYEQAISLRPEDANIYFSRGLLHHQRKDFDAAIADYSRTIELNDQHARAFYNRGLLYRKAGTDFLAVRDFQAATDIEPSFARAHVNSGYTRLFPMLPLLFVLALG